MTGNDSKNQRDNTTLKTEESDEYSVYDSLLSSCCCSSSSNNKNSLVEVTKKKGLKSTWTRNNQPKTGNDLTDDQIEVDDTPPIKIYERLSDVILFLTGSAPPVKIVRCFECASVDGSELTTPRPLLDLAEDYDRDNKWHVQGMWSGDLTNDNTNATSNLSNEDGGEKPMRSWSSSRWSRLRSSGSRMSEVRSQRDGNVGKQKKKSRRSLNRHRRSLKAEI